MTTMHPTFNLETLLLDLIDWPTDYPITITGLSADSRTTQPGDLFLAHAATREHHEQHIQQAIENGAVAVLRESFENIENFVVKQYKNHSAPILAVPILRSKVGLIAARFYGYPSENVHVVGITGTNGKTSCSQYIAQILEKNQHPCGVIGTLGTGFPDNIHADAASLTTPDAINLQKTLAELKQNGAEYIAMEVSSHSLAQHRVAGVNFEIGVFTNLTQDHLDYHGTMENYGQAKRQLFLSPNLGHAVINADDAFGQTLLSEFSPKISCYAYTLQDTETFIPTVSAHNIKLNHHGISAQIKTPWGEGTLKTHLLGKFNLSNLLAVITTLGVLGIPLNDILAHIPKLKTVPGRMQMAGGGKLPLVVVDYAHTPDALEKALTSLREHTHGQLWCVFGCGGNRDKNKRHMMGEIAERFSDQLIITDDNPRFENPEDIANDILKGLLCPWAAEVEHDRHTAIAHAIDCATAGDIILVAGKGHETYQYIAEEKIPFNDMEQVLAQLKLKEA